MEENVSKKLEAGFRTADKVLEKLSELQEKLERLLQKLDGLAESMG